MYVNAFCTLFDIVEQLRNSVLIFVLTMAEIETSDSLRAKGNEYYRKKDYENAIDYYTKSLNIEKTAAWYESGP